MASSGREKFEKYFKDREVETTVKAEAPLYSTDGKVGTLASGTAIVVLPQSEYSPRYPVRLDSGEQLFVSERFVAKPVVTFGATENLGIKTNDLVAGGEKRFFEGTEVAWFDDRETLRRSILDGLAKNPKIDNVTFGKVEGLLENKKTDWNDVPKSHVNELGKYIGEILPFFSIDILECHSIQSVAFPTSANYCTTDSFAVLTNGETIGISSKFGDGAKSSLFNLIYTEYFDDCIYQKLAATYLDLERKIDTVYELGFREILNRPIDEPAKVYQNIVAKVHTPILDEIRPELPSEFQDHFPNSLTSYFCRSIAARINECTVSINTINNVINRKQIVQIKLDQNRWRDGEIKFLVKKFNDARARVIGNKSAIADVRQKQGLLNYVIR